MTQMLQTQRTGKSLTEIFNSFTEDAVKRFPGLNGRLIVLDMNEQKVHAAGVPTQAAVNYMQTRQDERGQPLIDVLAQNPNKGTASTYDPHMGLTLIMNNERIDRSELNNVSEASEVRLLYAMDHELGHWGIDNGSFANRGDGSGNDYATMIGESVADAYALIRHYQRFGTGETSDKYVDPAKRAYDMILGGSLGHFTSFVLEEIAQQKDKIDFASLNPAETAELARRFAQQYAPSAPVLEDLLKAFAPLRRTGDNPIAAVQTLVNITLDPKAGYYTFKLGDIWLKDMLKDDGLINKLNISPQAKANLSKELKEREFRFEQDGILFNMPGAQKKPQAAAPANQNGAVTFQYAM